MALQRIDEGLWTLAGHFRTPFFTGSVRMTVLGGEEGLVLYSPVALAAEEVAAIEALGQVVAIVAPNLFHHAYLRAAAAAFPSARVFVPEGLEAKIGPVLRAQTMTRANPPTLPGGIEPFVLAGHTIHETLLFHRATRTLVTADMIYNYQRENGRGEKAFFRLMGCYGAPKVVFYHRFALADKSAVPELVAQVRAWAPRRIVMSHGRIVEGEDCAEVFARAWQPFVRQRL